MERRKFSLVMFVVLAFCFTANTVAAQDLEELEEAVEITDDDPVMRADLMPVFPGCEESSANSVASDCSTKKLIEYVVKHVEYPQLAKENNIEGRVFVEFVVDKEGLVKNVKIVRGVDDLLDAEALRVVNSLPTWTPGEQAGKKVNVKMVLPIAFRLG